MIGKGLFLFVRHIASRRVCDDLTVPILQPVNDPFELHPAASPTVKIVTDGLLHEGAPLPG
jgi:hypothetical protein